jgi:hypothetical protein
MVQGISSLKIGALQVKRSKKGTSGCCWTDDGLRQLKVLWYQRHFLPGTSRLTVNLNEFSCLSLQVPSTALLTSSFLLVRKIASRDSKRVRRSRKRKADRAADSMQKLSDKRRSNAISLLSRIFYLLQSHALEQTGGTTAGVACRVHGKKCRQLWTINRQKAPTILKKRAPCTFLSVLQHLLV